MEYSKDNTLLFRGVVGENPGGGFDHKGAIAIYSHAFTPRLNLHEYDYVVWRIRAREPQKFYEEKTEEEKTGEYKIEMTAQDEEKLEDSGLGVSVSIAKNPQSAFDKTSPAPSIVASLINLPLPLTMFFPVSASDAYSGTEIWPIIECSHSSRFLSMKYQQGPLYHFPATLPSSGEWVNVLVPISNNVREVWPFTFGFKSLRQESSYLDMQLPFDKNDDKQKFLTPRDYLTYHEYFDACNIARIGLTIPYTKLGPFCIEIQSVSVVKGKESIALFDPMRRRNI